MTIRYIKSRWRCPTIGWTPLGDKAIKAANAHSNNPLDEGFVEEHSLCDENNNDGFDETDQIADTQTTTHTVNDYSMMQRPYMKM